MGDTRFYGLFDQAGIGSPLSGDQAAAFRRLSGVKQQTLVHGVTGKDVGGFEGNVGFFHPVGVQDAPLATANGYFGSAPGSIQPMFTKPDPWLDPTGASR